MLSQKMVNQGPCLVGLNIPVQYPPIQSGLDNIINAGDLKALYPQLDIDPMKEIRPVDTKVLNVWQKNNDPPTMLTFRLPESKHFKTNVKRLTIDLSRWQWVKGGLHVIHSSTLLDRRQEQKFISPHHFPTPL